MNTERANVGWSFWLMWVFASCLGFAVGGAIGVFILNALALGEGFAGLAIFGAIFGAIGGLMQWFVLRRHVARSGWWVLATAVAYCLAGIMTEWVFRQVPYSEVAVAGIAPFGAVAGIVGGTMQWFVLRQHIARAGWWVLASIVGLVVGMGITLPVAMTLGQTGRVIEFATVIGISFGIGVGTIPGSVLVWLLRQPPSHTVEVMATTAH